MIVYGTSLPSNNLHVPITAHSRLLWGGNRKTSVLMIFQP